MCSLKDFHRADHFSKNLFLKKFVWKCQKWIHISSLQDWWDNTHLKRDHFPKEPPKLWRINKIQLNPMLWRKMWGEYEYCVCVYAYMFYLNEYPSFYNEYTDIDTIGNTQAVMNLQNVFNFNRELDKLNSKMEYVAITTSVIRCISSLFLQWNCY